MRIIDAEKSFDPVSYTHLDVYKRQVYAHTREECEEKLKTLIAEMKAEIAEAQRLKDKMCIRDRYWTPQ